ncbi:thiamine-phosphate kinase [Gracilibacillus halophilus]|nr:thiamine-phosphate kinase [Gracilibacillus halophilus]
MDEFDFIRSIQPKYYRQSSVIKGIGDDAAIIRSLNQDIITTVDTMVESIHFTTQTMEPFHVGYRALAANISDIVAMGGKPTSFLVSIVVPKNWEKEQLREIYQGIDQLAQKFQMDVIGGDTVTGQQLTISITVFGSVNKHQVRYRSHAQAGDVVFVTGTIGDAACGLDLLLHEDQDTQQNYEYFINRHRMPLPRVNFIQATGNIKRMALNDISDGISNEANEIAEASHVALRINEKAIPYHIGITDFPKEKQQQWLLSGGEDFELLGTVSPNEWEKLVSIAEKTNTKITKIGEVFHHDRYNGSVLINNGSSSVILDKSGYTHLRGDNNE